MSQYPLDQRLQDAGAATKRAAESTVTAHRLLRKAAREAHRRGWTKVRIAQTAGVSRQTVHNLLKEDR